uniref:Uncharacterized protein n=1 Tax=viral metagenome TaxID=1070528 RepID=A0A6C0ENM2_9ZZZZ
MSVFKQPLDSFMSRPPVAIPRPPVAIIPVARKLTTDDTLANLNEAQRLHYAAEDEKEKQDKQSAVTKSRNTLAAASAKVQAAKALEGERKEEMNVIPDDEERKLAVIEQHNAAVAKLADAKDAYAAAEAVHKAALANAPTGGRRRRRHTRHKRRKSKHRSHKRRTKKHRKIRTKKHRKIRTKKHRKIRTKTRRRSRRR